MLGTLSRLHLKTGRAYQMRLAFQDIYKEPTRGWAELMLDRWDSWVMHSRLEPMKDVARTIRRHRDGILAWFDSEGINSLVQAAKAKARGYRSSKRRWNHRTPFMASNF